MEILMSILFIGIWLLIMAIIANEFGNIAEMKGHSKSKYDRWTFLAMPIGIAMVIALPDHRQVSSNESKIDGRGPNYVPNAQMDERNKTKEKTLLSVFKNSSVYYTDNCSAIIDCIELQKDSEDGNIFAYIRIKNIGEKNIIAYKVKIDAYTISGAEIEGIEYSYLDINVKRNARFGFDTKIKMPSNLTRKISVKIVEIVYDDGAVWSDNDCKWNELDNQQELSEYFSNKELKDKYVKKISYRAKFVPRKNEAFVQCTCGEIISKSTENCPTCKVKFEKVFEYLDAEKLMEKPSQHVEEKSEKMVTPEENLDFKYLDKYEKLIEQFSTATTFEELGVIKEQFGEMGDYRDASVYYEKCSEARREIDRINREKNKKNKRK